MAHQSKKLKSKGDSAPIKLQSKNFQAELYWLTDIDLDLWTFYNLKNPGSSAPPPPAKKGFWKSLFGSDDNTGNGQPTRLSGKVGYNCHQRDTMRVSKGRATNMVAPYIWIDKDAGVGDTVDSVSGKKENRETTTFEDISKVDSAIICAKIFGNGSNFAPYNGRVTIQGPGVEPLVVDLTESKPGKWAVVAMVDNTTGTPRLININETMRGEPNLAEYVRKYT